MFASAWMRAGSRLRQFLCFVLIDIRCFCVPPVEDHWFRSTVISSFLSVPRYCEWSLSFRFSDQKFTCIPFLCHAFCVSPQYTPPSLDHLAQDTSFKLFIMSCPMASCYPNILLRTLSSKSFCVLPQMWTTHTKQKVQFITVLISVFKDSGQEDIRLRNEWYQAFLEFDLLLSIITHMSDNTVKFNDLK
jgi:hypothetical protein